VNKFPLEPPRELIMPHTWDQVTVILSVIIMILCALYGLWQTISRREPLMLFLLIGATAASMLEAICNVLGMAYHPQIGQITGYSSLGRDIPVYVTTIYSWYFASFAYAFITWDEKKTFTPKRYWFVFAAAAIFALFIEILPVRAGMWLYYGPQPLTFFGMPLMWYVVNPTSIVTAAAFLTLAFRNRAGWARWPIPFLFPVVVIGFHTGLFAPVYITENAGWTANESILTALISTGMCALLLMTFQRLLFSTSTTVKKQ
jgi:hypothetical protein